MIPGKWLRAVARRCFNERVMERVIDPTLADVQREYLSAGRCRRAWPLVAGYAGFWRAVVHVAPVSSWEGLIEWGRDDDAVVGRTLRAGSLILIVLVVALCSPAWARSGSSPAGWRSAYLVPGALVLAMPMAVFAGVLWGLLRCRTVSESRLPRMRRAMVTIGLVASLVVLWMTASVVPRSNQAFRVAIAGTDIRKGFNEMSFDEVRWLMRDMRRHGQAGLAGRHELVYYSHVGMSGATFCFAVLALALAISRFRQTVVAVGATLSMGVYWTAFTAVSQTRGQFLERPGIPFLLAWLPNLVLLAATCALLFLSKRRRIVPR